ncbi:hypothetical protein, partial [Wolbachia endosymbiont of Pentidionis agamae]|uniref:hypothetical protein n=1 Tax=Wolbachia endosymbiont of Pentidionis agamae TaxID=3110435 RepID=UPI002FD0C4E9
LNINSKVKIMIIKQKTKNYWLYAKDIVIGTSISLAVFTFAVPTVAAASIGLLHAFELGDKFCKIAEKLPSFMQFTIDPSLGSYNAAVSLLTYISAILAVAITAGVIYGLYKTHSNAKEIGRNEVKKEFLNILEFEVAATLKDNGYIALSFPKEMSKLMKCQLVSKSGKKIANLQFTGKCKKNEQDDKVNYLFSVSGYHNNSKNQEESASLKLKEDFFHNKNIRKNVRARCYLSTKMDHLVVENPIQDNNISK